MFLKHVYLALLYRAQIMKTAILILPLFQKILPGYLFYDVQKISKYRKSVDLKLEVHPFSLEDTVS